MITYIIIGITVLFSFLCFRDVRLFEKNAFVPYRVFRNGEWYRIITHGFVHADMTHLFVNMLTLWSFGLFVEDAFNILDFGKGGYAGLYFGGMAAASLFDLFKRKEDASYVSIGASGAVAAVLFTSILLNPWGKILFFGILPVPGLVFGILYLVYCQYMAKRGGDNINHNAHFYGSVFGLLYPVVFKPELLELFFINVFPE